MVNNKYTKYLINIVLMLTIVFLLTKISFILDPVFDIIRILVAPFIVTIFLYYTLRPITNKLSSIKYKGVISLLIVVAFIVFLAIILFVGGNTVKNQFEETIINKQFNLSSLQNLLEGKVAGIEYNLADVFTDLFDKLKGSLSSISSNSMKIFSGIGNIGTQIILIPFILFYLLKEEDLFEDRLGRLLPSKYKKETLDMGREIDSILTIYIGGQLLVASIIGVLMFIGYIIIGMPSALLMAIFTAITAVIPLIGSFLGVMPAILLALTDDISLVFKIVILAVVVQQIEGNLITPKIMGDKLFLHPLAVIFIVLISVHLMGILGAFVGIPLFLIIQVLGRFVIKIKKERVTKDK